MSESNDFPRLLYRQPGEHEVWGLKVDLLEVHDEDSLEAALGEGWALRPDETGGADPATSSEFSLLDEPLRVIKELLPALTGDELKALIEAEKGGKTRKGVIAALEEALAALEAAPTEDAGQ